MSGGITPPTAAQKDCNSVCSSIHTRCVYDGRVSMVDDILTRYGRPAYHWWCGPGFSQTSVPNATQLIQIVNVL